MPDIIQRFACWHFDEPERMLGSIIRVDQRGRYRVIRYSSVVRWRRVWKGDRQWQIGYRWFTAVFEERNYRLSL